MIMKNKAKGLVALSIILAIVLMSFSPAFAASSRYNVELTDNEKEYIRNAGTISIALSPDNFPYSSNETGQMTGVFPEIIEMISSETGLKFEILDCKTYEDYAKLKSERKADVIFATHVDNETAKNVGYELTPSYFTIPFSKIELKTNESDVSGIATLEAPSAEASVATKYYYSDQITTFPSKDACLQALNDHKCEAVIINRYDAEYIQYSDVRNQYVIKELYDNTIPISAAVNLNADSRLLDIIEKSLNSIDDIVKEEIINRNTQQAEKDNSITELVYTNPVLSISIMVAFFILICGIIILVFRYKNAKLIQHQDKEYRTFMRYICAAVDTVTELNLIDKTLIRYTLEDGEIIEEKESYPDDEWLMFHEEDRARIKELCSNERLMYLCKNNRTIYEECRMKWNHSNEYQWCTTILQGIIPTKDKPFNLLLLLKNTNEMKVKEAKQRQALEEALELAKHASASKGSFLSNMSHEIRTPLNAIIGYLSLAKDDDISRERLMHCIDNCDVASKHLLQIINDVLDMSSIESGKMKIAHEDFDLKKEISEVTTIFFQNAKAKGVNFETHIENLTEEWVVGDQLRVNQILMNLLSNAVKFTPENGTVQLKVNQINNEDKKVHIQFIVSDTGIGMSQEYKERIFRPFEQENAGTAKKFGGSGLGLSITNNLIQMMAGKIDVKSEPEKGTTFTVTLSFGKAEKQLRKADEAVDYSSIRVLVVDDKQDECTYVKTMLKRCGVKADVVTSGEMALKRIRSRFSSDYKYDLCIIDWNMPEMNGGEVTRRIRQEFGNDMPVIIATAYDITEFEDEAKRAGADKIVSKPLFQSTLFDLIVSTFGKYDPQENSEMKKEKIDMSGVNVLLAEDNAMNMEIAVSTLEKVGIKVEQAVNGQDVYEKFMDCKEGTYDLILMDVQMPIMDGYEATNKIRKSNHPEAKTIPIIAMTANAFAEDVTEALSNGMNAHIAKPINYDKLFRILKEYSK